MEGGSESLVWNILCWGAWDILLDVFNYFLLSNFPFSLNDLITIYEYWILMAPRSISQPGSPSWISNSYVYSLLSFIDLNFELSFLICKQQYQILIIGLFW